MRHPTRVRNQPFVAVIALALAAIATAGGGAAAAAGSAGDASQHPVPQGGEQVLDRTRHGRDALTRLESGGHLATVAAEVGWSPAQLRQALASDETLNVRPDGQLLYVEAALPQAGALGSQPTATTLSTAATPSADAETFTLHSLPGSSKVIYLDFVGMASGTSLFFPTGPPVTYPAFDLDGNVPCPVGTVDPACFTAAELAMIRDTWARVAETYSAFDVDVTTRDPGADALHRLECVTDPGEGVPTVVCPPGVAPGTSDLQYGARIMFSDSPECGPTALGCALVGTFDDEQVLGATDPQGLVRTRASDPSLTSRTLGTVAAHEVGHTLGLLHDVAPAGRPTIAPAGPVVTPLMRPALATGGSGAPLEHFTPTPCPLDEQHQVSVTCSRNYRDSYGWMATHGLAVRADEASPVVEPAPSFVAHGVITPPVITGPRFYAPAAPVNFDAWYSATTADSDPGAGVVRLDSATQTDATVLRIDDTDAHAANVAALVDSFDDLTDDDVPMKTMVKVYAAAAPSRFVLFSVAAVDARAGYRNVLATVIDYSGPLPFADDEAVVVSYLGTGASAPMDQDSYAFTVPAGAASTSISVVPPAHSNLDVAATLYEHTGTAVATSDPRSVRVDQDTATGLDASITATLAPGEYTLVVAGAGVPGSYTDYGSIGSYTVTALTTFPTGISVGGGSVAEGDTGKPRTVTFPVVLPAPSTSPVSVHYAIEADGSAQAATGCATATACASGGGDFRTKTGTLTFTPSRTTGRTPTVKYLNALVYPDTTDTSDETFGVVLSNPVGVALGRAGAVGTILNDDPVGTTPVVSVGDATVPEGNSALKVTTTNGGKVPITLSQPATTTVSVQVTVTPTAATAGTDFKFGSTRTFPVTKTVTFTAGQWQKSIAIGVFPDATVEGDETVTLTLTNPSAGLALGRSTGRFTILDDDLA